MTIQKRGLTTESEDELLMLLFLASCWHRSQKDASQRVRIDLKKS